MPRATPDDVDPRRCIAVGEGVDQAVTGKKCKFAVQGVLGLVNLVSVEIEGPANPSVEKEADEGGHIVCSYVPPVSGQYTLNIRVKDKAIKNNPYHCEVIGDSDPKLKKVELVEVQGKGVILAKATKENIFYVDARRANISAGLGGECHILNLKLASKQQRTTLFTSLDSSLRSASDISFPFPFPFSLCLSLLSLTLFFSVNHS